MTPTKELAGTDKTLKTALMNQHPPVVFAVPSPWRRRRMICLTPE